VAAIVPSASARPARTVLLFPDLDQRAPAAVTLRAVTVSGAQHLRLGFASNVENVGRGPLVIEGRRRATTVPGMRATQYVRIQHAAWRPVAHAGTIRFNVAHSHWHLLPFETYELRGRNGAVVRGHKSGFCLGDRYVARTAVAGPRPLEPVHTSRCGLGRPGLLGVREGISVGYGDDYAANLEGQYLLLDGLPAGEYLLVHRVNADRRLRESSYDNDAASLRLGLEWQDGEPRIRVLGVCPDTAVCAPASSPR
jgi:hypothetical protein